MFFFFPKPGVLIGDAGFFRQKSVSVARTRFVKMSSSSFNVGDKVMVFLENVETRDGVMTGYYPGKVVAKQRNSYSVLFDDKDKGSFPSSQMILKSDFKRVTKEKQNKKSVPVLFYLFCFSSYILLKSFNGSVLIPALRNYEFQGGFPGEDG
jgi:hypothetical protein